MHLIGAEPRILESQHVDSSLRVHTPQSAHFRRDDAVDNVLTTHSSCHNSTQVYATPQQPTSQDSTREGEGERGKEGSRREGRVRSDSNRKTFLSFF